MNRSATSLVFAWLVMAATPAVAGAQEECVYGQGQPCEHTSDCAGFADAPLCVDGACQMPCDDGTGQPVAKSCSLGETCVAGESPGVGERYYCKPGTFSMDLSLLDSCLYHFVEDIQPDLSSGDSCSLARNLNVLLDRDGTDGFTIYDADLCIKDFLAEKPCNTGSRSCANGQVYCDDDVECGEGLYCNQELHHCERECGVIPSRSSLQTSLDRECVAPLTSCDYLRGRCEPVDIRDAECAIDRDCPHGATCFLGQCAPRCFRSLDCPDSGWYCAADNTCKPKPSAGSEGAAFDPKQYSVQLAQREVRLDEFNDSYDIPLLIMSTVTRKQVFSDPNVVFGYRLEASYARKQDPVCLGNLTGLAPDVQKDCVISADEEFVSFDNPFGTVYAEGDPALRVRLNRGAVKGLSPGVYQATLTAIFNNGVTTSGTISFEKSSPSGEYGGRFSVYLGDAQTGLLGTMNLGMRLNVASSGSWVWDDLLRDNNIAVQRDYDDVTRGLPVVGTIHGVESAAFAQPSALTPKDNEIAVKGIYSPQLGRMHLVAVIDLTASYCRGEAGPCTPSDASDLEVKNAFERPVRRVIELLGPFDAKTRKFDGMYRETISGLVPYDVTLDGWVHRAADLAERRAHYGRKALARRSARDGRLPCAAERAREREPRNCQVRSGRCRALRRPGGVRSIPGPVRRGGARARRPGELRREAAPGIERARALVEPGRADPYGLLQGLHPVLRRRPHHQLHQRKGRRLWPRPPPARLTLEVGAARPGARAGKLAAQRCTAVLQRSRGPWQRLPRGGQPGAHAGHVAGAQPLLPRDRQRSYLPCR